MKPSRLLRPTRGGLAASFPNQLDNLVTFGALGSGTYTGQYNVWLNAPGRPLGFGPNGGNRGGPSPAATAGGAAGPRAPWAGTGRNAPCPCGSGKKFKHCHGRI